MKKKLVNSNFKSVLLVSFLMLYASCKQDDTNEFSINDFKITQEKVNNTLHGKFKFKNFTYSNTELDAGSSGENVNWDFSSLNDISTDFTSVVENCPENLNCNQFSNSDKISFLEGENSYTYFSFSNNEFLELGSYSTENGKNTYSDPKITYKFPITYGQTYQDSFYASYEFSTEGNIAGNQTIAVDGYGTLKIPSGTFTPVLRIKRMQNISNPMIPGLTTTIVSYEWIDKEGIIRLTLLNNNTTYLSNINQNASIYYLIDVE